MKGYTDLEQSKVLAEILPSESADYFWIIGHLHTDGPRYEIVRPRNEVSDVDRYWPCWSLSALLDAMPPIQELCSSTNHYYRVFCMNHFSEWHDNAIDSCVEMIIRLHEKGLL